MSQSLKKAYIKTYGCQMNEQDTAQMFTLLGQAGYEKTADVHEADFILLNTCSIREKAVNKIYSEMGRIRPLKDDHPDLILGIAGCVAEQEKQELARRFPYLDLVFGPDHIRKLPEMIGDVIEGRAETGIVESPKTTVLRTGFDKRQDFEFVNVLPGAEETPVKAFVNIQKGCDNICSFCIVPFVRGREVSRPHQEIVREIQGLVERGVKEVMLLGQNVNSYGLKTTGGLSFAQLLAEIAEKTDLKRLRFTTSHPKDVKSDLVEQFATNPILVPHFHLPVQCGSTRILDLMKRQYSREQYLDIVSELKSRVPEIRFSTDMIVGFPGETRSEFEETLSLMQEVKYDQIFSFVYSPRPYTKAVKLEDDVPLVEKQTRLKELQDLDREIVAALKKQDVGTEKEVLVEAIEPDNLDYGLKGRSPCNKVVHFKGKAQPGDFVQVRITQANPFSLYGEAA